MNPMIIQPGGRLCGRVQVPGDKSISHRALLLGALADGTSHITDFNPSGDCLATLDCIRALGIQVDWQDHTSLTIHGRGLRGLRPPDGPLHCGRSGTTMRLLAGVLAGQPFTSTLTGDPQLLRRPMRRVVAPLRAMGATIEDNDGRAPLVLHGRPLRGRDHTLAVASAQVKSAVMLAGLYADSPTTIHQPGPARDHTERMLAAMGAALQTDGLSVTLSPSHRLAPLSLTVPGDLSSAAFLLVAALLVPDSQVTLAGVGVNPTRTGLLEVLWAMGATIELTNEGLQGNEPVADLTACTSSLHSVEIGGETAVRMIDEFPVLAVAATQAHGTTVVRDAAELRVKETDRIATVVCELQLLGANIEPQPDGFVVTGPTHLHGAPVHSHGDHRLAMALAVAGLIARGTTAVADAGCIADSFPGFDATVTGLLEAATGDQAQRGKIDTAEKGGMAGGLIDD